MISNRLTALFEQKKNNLLNIYFTAGFPHLEDTVTIINALEKAGADMVEIGMPFSDPLADGPTIQESSQVALENGMTMKKMFQQLEGIRAKVNIPIMLMGYLNPVMQYGIENFCKKAQEVGIDGVILPDLPFDEYNEKYAHIFKAANLCNIFLVTPETSPERLKNIDASASGFIYAVSTNSTTGGHKGVAAAQPYFERLKNADLKNPFMIGFNINENKDFEFACQYADGAIIGTAFIKMIAKSTAYESDIQQFVSSIRDGK
jgi:tryptophan synthase alpha chain